MWTHTIGRSVGHIGESDECLQVMIALLQGKMSFVGSAQLEVVKEKRNQIRYIVSGLPNHQFGYVVQGNLSISNQSGPYVFCSRSADG